MSRLTQDSGASQDLGLLALKLRTSQVKLGRMGHPIWGPQSVSRDGALSPPRGSTEENVLSPGTGEAKAMPGPHTMMWLESSHLWLQVIIRVRSGWGCVGAGGRAWTYEWSFLAGLLTRQGFWEPKGAEPERGHQQDLPGQKDLRQRHQWPKS